MPVLALVLALATSFGGRWETTFGPMTLERQAGQVKGAYVMDGQACSIRGRLEGRRVTFRYREPGTEGEGWFTLAADGRSFAGRWPADGEGFPASAFP